MTMKNVKASVSAEAWKLAGFAAIVAAVMIYTSGLSICMIVAAGVISLSPIILLIEDERYRFALAIVGLIASLYGGWLSMFVYIIIKVLVGSCIDFDILSKIKE